MSEDTVIRVEGLGKKYRIGASRSNERYTTLRDTLATKARALIRNRQSKLQGGSEGETDFWALKDVSFEIRHGEVLGIIGRNGAGKSTLLKILSRITDPTEGKVSVRGRVASLLEVGTGFHPELTGRENIFLNGAILGMTRAEIQKKFDEIVAFAEVERFLDTPVKRYSSGMYVRLAFAIAAHLEPEILIVDEVLAVGDAEFQKKCLSKMEQVARREGKTVLLVSHTLPVIKQLATRAVLLREGKVAASGVPETVVAEYLNHTGGAVLPGRYVAEAKSTRPSFTAVEVKTSDAGYLHRLGEPLRVVVEIHCPAQEDNLWLSLRFLYNDGRPACFACYVDPAGKRSSHRLGPLPTGVHRFFCDLQRFPGYMGTYTVEATLFDEKHQRTVEQVERICSYNVYIPADFVTGSDWSPGLCAFLVPFSWHRAKE